VKASDNDAEFLIEILQREELLNLRQKMIKDKHCW
jgi:hypothetical protein